MTCSDPGAAPIRVSVVIATRDRPDHLRRCLEALSRLDPPPLEAVVVDDGETDPAKLAALCASLGLALQYRSKRPPGTCGSRNLGVRLAKGDYILFIDDDVLLEPEYLAPVQSEFESDASIGGVGGSLEDRLPGSRAGVRALFRFLRILFLIESRVPGRVLPSGFRTHARRTERARDVQVLSTSNSCYRREVFGKVLFDEAYDRMSGGYAFGEDADFSYRVSQRWRLRITPDAKGFHEYAPPHFVARERLEKIYLIHHYHFLKNSMGLNLPRAAAFAWAMAGIAVCDLLALALRPNKANRELLAYHLGGMWIIVTGRADRLFREQGSAAAAPPE